MTHEIVSDAASDSKSTLLPQALSGTEIGNLRLLPDRTPAPPAEPPRPIPLRWPEAWSTVQAEPSAEAAAEATDAPLPQALSDSVIGVRTEFPDSTAPCFVAGVAAATAPAAVPDVVEQPAEEDELRRETVFPHRFNPRLI